MTKITQKPKRILGLFLALMLLISALPMAGLPALAAEELEYVYNDATMTAVVDINQEYTGTSVTIPQTVTKDDQSYTVTGINNEAFKNVATLKEVVFLGENAPVIGTDAFAGVASGGTVSYPADGQGYDAAAFTDAFPEAWTVAAAKTTVTITGLDIANSTYTKDTPHAGYTGTAVFKDGETPVTPTVATLTVLYTGETNAAENKAYSSATPPTEAGTYTVTVTLAGDADYEGSWSKEFTIAKAAQTEKPEAFALSYTYDKDTKGYVVTIPEEEGLEYSFDGTTYGTTNIYTAGKAKDEVTGYARFAETANYLAGESVNAKLTLPETPVEKIEVKGKDGATKIEVRGGTLQMEATVTPSGAKQEVEWSVSNDTLATISKTGLLTAKADGKVKVHASATDGSSAYGEVEITITEQALKNVEIIAGENGTAKADKPNAQNNDKVTITIDPKTGYELDKIEVKERKTGGKVVETTKNTDGTYSFTYTGEPVDVTVSFKETNPKMPFTDVVTKDWFYDHVLFVYRNDMFAGSSDTEFEPRRVMNRAMMAQALYNLAGKPKETTTAVFTDVASNAWYAEAVNWAAKNNIVKGIGENKFAPTQTVTREQMAVMLNNYCKNYLKVELKATREYAAFIDNAKINSWATEAVKVMYSAEVLDGRTGGAFDPQGGAIRAEVASMFRNFAEAEIIDIVETPAAS